MIDGDLELYDERFCGPVAGESLVDLLLPVALTA